MKDHETLKHKLEDLKETLRLSEVKLLKSKSKLETEKKQLSDEKNLLLSKKTSKYKKLKEEYTLLQQKQNDHIELNKTFEKEINILKNEKNILEDHLFNIKREFSLLEERNLDQTRNIDLCNKEKSEKEILLQSEINEKAVLKSEIECFKKNLKNLERKVQENEEISQKDYKILTEIRQENSLLIEERANLKEICNKLESQLEFVQTQHNHEIEELDKRTENLIEEMKTLKEENQEMRVRETEMRKNLISSEESMSNLKEKYLKLKFSSRGLKNHLKEVRICFCLIINIYR